MGIYLGHVKGYNIASFGGALMDVFDGRQLTAARALADLSLAELARDAQVTICTVHRLEVGGTAHVSEKRRHGHVSREIWQRLLSTLARHGGEARP